MSGVCEHGALVRIVEWVVLFNGEDDGERWPDRTAAEDRVEEIREQIADGQFDAADYEPLTIAVTHQWRSDWTTPTAPDGDANQED